MSVTLAVAQSLEALEQRRFQSVANDLRHAAHTLEMHQMMGDSMPHSAQDLDEARSALAGDLSPTFDALSTDDRAQVVRLVDAALAGPEAAHQHSDATLHDHATSGHGVHEDWSHSHDLAHLVGLFSRAGAAAGTAAEAAESDAIRMVLVAGVSGAATAALLFCGRRRERELRENLRRQASTDELTALPNRRHLEGTLHDASEQMRADGGFTGLLYLDLDDFKGINDSRGHEVGDILLTIAAERLREAKRGGETLVRIGGDEFAVVLPQLPTARSAAAVAGRYLEILDAPCEIAPGHVEALRASIGVAVTDDPDGLEELRREADLAMYAAKHRGGHGMAVFDPSMRSSAERSGDIMQALRGADIDREFHLVFQPVVDIDDESVLFAEALLRWTSPTLGSVPPGDFIPVAEKTGEIHRLGSWVVHTVIDQLAAWNDDEDSAHIAISCNISALQLAEPDFVPRVVHHLRSAGVAPDRLTIEVTESAVLDRSDAAADRLAELRRAGVRIAIDDFGSGYSNLGQLLHAPFDVLKIDRSLLLQVTAMQEQFGLASDDPSEIMSAIASIARSLDVEVVCEGIETEAQRASMRASGVSHIQGWLIGRPVPPTEFVERFGRLVVLT